MTRLGRTLDAWHEELLAYWTPTGRRGVSNGPTEAVNALIKKVKRVGDGFRNVANYRLDCSSPSVSTGTPSPGRLRPPPRSEAAHHAWWRRAPLLGLPLGRARSAPLSAILICRWRSTGDCCSLS